MEIIGRRSPIVLIWLAVLSALLLGQLLSFQFRLNPSLEQFEESASTRGVYTERINPNRGQIYDRDMVVLAVNSFEYRVGVSPSLVIDRREAATQLAAALNLNEAEIYRQLQPDLNGQFPEFVFLAGPIDDATARRVEDLDITGVTIEPIPLRSYPQDYLTAQVVGFVNYSEEGFFGVEGEYDRLLAGTAREIETSGTIYELSERPDASDGQSLMLTIDRDIQFVVTEVLQEAIQTYNAKGGTIIVMNPRTGEILGMQSWPPFEVDDVPTLSREDGFIYNPAIGFTFEPGSVMKVVTASIALQVNESGLDLNWTYNNTGCMEMAGVTICDSDRVAKGNVDFRNCIIKSLNTCTATWYSIVGPAKVYPLLQDFGFGKPTGVDMEGEEGGIVNLPSGPRWSEADFLNVSYGQGISVTPLQMLNAVNTVANDGLMMQPHIVKVRYDGAYRFETQPNPIGRPISAEVADAITEIMIATVRAGEYDERGAIEGYSVAGKTGTAQQPTPAGYSVTDSWASFVGFLPADDPIISAIVVLDRPDQYWGSLTAAPTFNLLMRRLVVLMEIPPDNIRLQLNQVGGDPFSRDYVR